MSHSSINRRDAVLMSAGLVVVATSPATAQSSQSGLKDIEPGVSVPPEDAAEIWAVLDKFMANFRAPIQDYVDKHLETYLFPHVRIASHKVVVVQDAKSYRDSLLQVEKLLPPGWDHSEWGMRKIVQADPEKVHVAVRFNRYKKDNSLIAGETSLYIMEKVNGRWGIRGRSSFAQ